MTCSDLSARDERKFPSELWTPTPPDRVGRLAVAAHRIHGLHIQFESPPGRRAGLEKDRG